MSWFRKTTLLSVALLAIQAFASQPGRTLSNSLPPGHWNMDVKRWTSTAADWQVKDLIGPPASETDSVAPTAVHGIFLGDSNDRNMLNDFCLKEEPQAQPHGHTVETFKTCWHRNLTLSWQALVGIHPTGPYWNGVQGTPSERLLHGLQIHHSQFDAGPDFLVVSSNLWDLWHWGTSNVSLLNDKRIASKELSAWGPHLTQVLEQVEANVPKETVLIFRTGAAGSWGACPDPDGTVPLPHVGVHKQHMYQLNAVAKGALRNSPRWYLMDVEPLLAEFDCPQHYLRDYIHMEPWVNWNILNLYINMLTHHWQRHGLPAWRTESSSSPRSHAWVETQSSH